MRALLVAAAFITGFGSLNSASAEEGYQLGTCEYTSPDFSFQFTGYSQSQGACTETEGLDGSGTFFTQVTLGNTQKSIRVVWGEPQGPWQRVTIDGEPALMLEISRCEYRLSTLDLRTSFSWTRGPSCQ